MTMVFLKPVNLRFGPSLDRNSKEPVTVPPHSGVKNLEEPFPDPSFKCPTGQRWWFSRKPLMAVSG
jgi:hypothetical protein